MAAGQAELTSIHQKVGIPYVFDVENDPKELWNINGANNWLSPIIGGIVRDYGMSVAQFPNLRPGADGPKALD